MAISSSTLAPTSPRTCWPRAGWAKANAVATGSAAGTLQGVRDFYERALPKQGFALGEGDAEEHEAETDFDGNGVSGHLRLRDGGGCVNVQLAVKHG